jgi:uncharacterized membrane protein YeiB
MTRTSMARTSSARVDAVDIARGIALLGMMLVHLGPGWSEGGPTWGHMIASGRAAPLFAMLAGVALSLVHRRDPQGVGSVRATCVRAAILIALGLSLGSLDDMPVYVILAFYGLMIVVALPFRGLSARTLLVLGLGWAVLAPVVLLWLQIEHGPVISDQAELTDLVPPWRLLAELVLWGAYPAGVWFAYVLVGLGVGRLDLGDLRTALRLVAAGALLVVVTLLTGWIAIARGVFTGWSLDDWRLLFVNTPYPYERAGWDELWFVGEHSSRPLNVLSAMGSALLVIGLCALLARLPWARLVLTPVRAAGAMTLTLYTIHVLWTWRIVVHARDTHDPSGGLDSYPDWLLQVVVLCAAATLWQRYVGRGPLESLIRLASVGGHEKAPRHEPGR